MKLYRICSIKDIFLKDLPTAKRKEAATFFHLENLYSNVHLKHIYMSKNHINSILIDEDGLSKIQLLTKLKFGVTPDIDDIRNEACPFNVNTIDKFTVNEPGQVTNIIKNHMKQDHIQKIIHLKKEALRESAIKKEILRSKIYNAHDKDFINKKTVSIDFEYINLNVFELGVSVHENGIIKNYHYLIKENYIHKKTKPDLQFKFKFGQTEIIPETMMSSIIKHHLNNADYLLLHGHSNDYLILRKYGLDLEQEEKIKIKDTILYYKKYFEPEQGDALTLQKMLRTFDIKPINMHNSGNDAAFTMELFIEMHKRVEIASKKIYKPVA